MKAKISNLKIGVSGVRGVIGETLTVKLVTSFAATFGTFLGKGRVIVGRDTRPSGEMIERAVASGLLSVGCQPVFTGIMPTPTIQNLVKEYNYFGGIIITASHNPTNWNALKFIGRNGLFLNIYENKALLDMYNQNEKGFVIEDEIQTAMFLENAFDVHEKKIFANIDIEKIREKRIKVAMDCCNGAGALYAPSFLKKLGCEVVPLFTSINGVFEREPEPTPQNISALCDLVKKEKCSLGFAQDPDADRLAVVNRYGKPIGENYTLVLAIKHILNKNPGPVTVNLVTTKAVEEIAKSAGVPFSYSMIGEINVTMQMLKEKAVIGGEGNGGVIWPAIHHCRDSFSAMALILEMIAENKQTLEDLLSEIPQYFASTAKVKISMEDAKRVISLLKKQFKDEQLNTIDGIRIDWEDSWVLIRSSNTEPIIRLQSEAKTQKKSDELSHQFAKICRNLI